jgi:hypothetical protein
MKLDDLQIAMKQSSLKELQIVLQLKECMDKNQDETFEGLWSNIPKMLFFYKLGVMQGKREERLKRKKFQSAGGVI